MFAILSVNILKRKIEVKMKEKKISLNIKGMTCDQCAVHVRKALDSVEGVKKVELQDWKSNNAAITLKENVKDDDLIDAVTQAGYQASVASNGEIDNVSDEKPLKRSSKTGIDFDLIVIGTGGGGVAAAIKASELGYHTAIIEGGEIGGTCVNIGCVPSKTLIRSAEAYHRTMKTNFRGIDTQPGQFDWKMILNQKKELVFKLRTTKYEAVLNKYENISLIRDWAHFEDPNKVVLGNGKTLRAAKIIIATGARPNILDVKGADSAELLTSTTIMELESLPQSLIVIGGRTIALELGQTFARFGVDVTILQRSERIIPDHEPELSDMLREYLEQEGLHIFTGVKYKEIREKNGRKTITTEIDGEEKVFSAEQVLMAVGRKPNIEKLHLDNVGVATDKNGFIQVNDYMQTSNPDIYAVGDVTTNPKFVYVAAAGGGIAAENALKGNNIELDLNVLPEVTFTDPQMTRIGLSKKQAVAQGIEVMTSVLPMIYVPRALAARDTRGMVKLIADKNTRQLLGAQILAPEAGEMIQTIAIALKNKMTTNDIRDMFFPYLTNVEAIKLAAIGFEKDVSALSCCAV